MSLAVRLPEHVAGGRSRFISNLLSSVGLTSARALYMPQYGEGTATADNAFAASWTHINTPASRVTALGKGAALAMNGTTDSISTPDRVSLTFGTGAADTVFSTFAVVKITDTAAARQIVSKNNTANLEWQFAVGATDLLTLTLTDNSAAVSASRAADAAVTQGSWITVGTSYDATGGATAANGIAIYQNGVVVASTATNNAGYVAMEDLAAVGEIGSRTAHTAEFFNGSIALVMVVAANLSAAQQLTLNKLSRSYFGI